MHGVHLCHGEVHNALLHRFVPVLPVIERIAIGVACIDAHAFDPETALRGKGGESLDKTAHVKDTMTYIVDSCTKLSGECHAKLGLGRIGEERLANGCGPVIEGLIETSSKGLSMKFINTTSHSKLFHFEQTPYSR